MVHFSLYNINGKFNAGFQLIYYIIAINCLQFWSVFFVPARFKLIFIGNHRQLEPIKLL